MERTFEDIKKAVMDAENWNMSNEEKEFFVAGLHWTLLSL